MDIALWHQLQRPLLERVFLHISAQDVSKVMRLSRHFHKFAEYNWRRLAAFEVPRVRIIRFGAGNHMEESTYFMIWFTDGRSRCFKMDRDAPVVFEGADNVPQYELPRQSIAALLRLINRRCKIAHVEVNFHGDVLYFLNNLLDATEEVKAEQFTLSCNSALRTEGRCPYMPMPSYDNIQIIRDRLFEVIERLGAKKMMLVDHYCQLRFIFRVDFFDRDAVFDWKRLRISIAHCPTSWDDGFLLSVDMEEIFLRVFGNGPSGDTHISSNFLPAWIGRWYRGGYPNSRRMVIDIEASVDALVASLPRLPWIQVPSCTMFQGECWVLQSANGQHALAVTFSPFCEHSCTLIITVDDEHTQGECLCAQREDEL